MNLGMLPEGERDGAGPPSGTKPVPAPHANAYAIRLILGPPARLAIAPVGTPPPPHPLWHILWAEDGSHWAGPHFTVRNDESAPPTLDPADLTAITQGDDDPR
jgi:hypothetical protein